MLPDGRKPGRLAGNKTVAAGWLNMEPDLAQEISERDQLWASLRGLRPEIDRLAAGDLDHSPRQDSLMTVIARVVAAEINFRERRMASE